jgi:adenosylcobinamide kinase/adenosylcobinamide-phosphate guanylyltransferase
MGKELILVLGGARAGKSAFAEKLAQAMGPRVLCVATAEPSDEEMRRRIRRHRQRRPAAWRVVEEPLEIAQALTPFLDATDVALIDCLTVWVSNLLLAALPGGVDQGFRQAEVAEKAVSRAVEDLLTCYHEGPASFVVVSNEVGMGLVPEYPLGRLYRDCLGRANQQVAAEADRVYYLVAGLALDWKSLGAVFPPADQAEPGEGGQGHAPNRR